jgi:hypothetical protein
MVPTGLGELDSLLGGGYPDRSTILVVGPPGIGEALGYWFAASGLTQGDFRLYATRLAVSEVREDIGAFGAHDQREPMWMADQGGQIKCDVGDLADLSIRIKKRLSKGSAAPRGRAIRHYEDT